MAVKTAPEVIEIPPLDIRTVEMRLVGDTPLVCNAWSKKAREMILAKQTKKARQAKAAKDPEADFLASLYVMDDGGYGFPTSAFKAALVDAALSVDQKKAEVRRAIHIPGDLVRIEGDTPLMREDMVRIGMGVADIRFRGEFRRWQVRLSVRYNARVISIAQIINLANTAGFAVGVGENRPERGGNWGMFHVATGEES